MYDLDMTSQLTEDFLPLHSNLKGLVFQHLRESSLELKDVAETWPLSMKTVRISLTEPHLLDNICGKGQTLRLQAPLLHRRAHHPC